MFLFFRNGKRQEPKMIMWEVLGWSSIISVSKVRNSRKEEPKSLKEVSIGNLSFRVNVMKSYTVLSYFKALI